MGYADEQRAAIEAAERAAWEHRPQTAEEQVALRRAFGGLIPAPYDLVADPDQMQFGRDAAPVTTTTAVRVTQSS